MPTLSVKAYAAIKLDGELIELGSLTIPSTRTLTQFTRKVVTVGTTTTKKVFDSTEDDIADFDFLWMACDRDLYVELTTDQGNQVGDELYTFLLKGSGTANKYGVPFILDDDNSYAAYGSNFSAGTLDVVDRIRVRNLSTTNAAQLLIARGT